MHDYRKFKVSVNGRIGRTARLSERRLRQHAPDPAGHFGHVSNQSNWQFHVYHERRVGRPRIPVWLARGILILLGVGHVSVCPKNSPHAESEGLLNVRNT